jgi:hypothetical protein
MRIVLKALAVLLLGTLLGLAVTWATVVRGSWGGDVANGPWRTSLATGGSDAGPYRRANVAVHGLLALGRDEAIYYTAARDSAGDALDGHCLYQLVGRDPPARWWSITAYGADDFLIPNAAGLYSVSLNSVARRADGRFAITVSKGEAASNWIPVSDGRFTLSLRLYNPGAAVAADPAHVALPQILKVSCE